MKLINDIINELVNTDNSISSPLLKTKVLASRLKNENLLNWVSNELEGYNKNEDLPEYRIYSGNITGTYVNGNKQYKNCPVPTSGMNKDFEKELNSIYLNHSVSSLENILSYNTNGSLDKILPAKIIALIEYNFRKKGNPYLKLINCKVSVGIEAVTEVLSVVRNSLLDFMLKIDNEFGNIIEIEELKAKGKEISTIMSQTIINTSGDGNIVNTGDKAKIEATINITKGDKDELAKHLTNIGISEADRTELIKMIDSEEPDKEKKTFGKKVNDWTIKMLSKALDGSWNVGIGAAGRLLSKAIEKYYGF